MSKDSIVTAAIAWRQEVAENNIGGEAHNALIAVIDDHLSDVNDFESRTCFLAGPEMCATHNRHASWCRLAAAERVAGGYVP